MSVVCSYTTTAPGENNPKHSSLSTFDHFTTAWQNSAICRELSLHWPVCLRNFCRVDDYVGLHLCRDWLVNESVNLSRAHQMHAVITRTLKKHRLLNGWQLACVRLQQWIQPSDQALQVLFYLQSGKVHSVSHAIALLHPLLKWKLHFPCTGVLVKPIFSSCCCAIKNMVITAEHQRASVYF